MLPMKLKGEVATRAGSNIGEMTKISPILFNFDYARWLLMNPDFGIEHFK
jgi:hypothetical protein